LSLVRVERRGAIALVTLDRPRANAFTAAFLDFWFGKDAQQRIRALVEKLRKKN